MKCRAQGYVWLSFCTKTLYAEFPITSSPLSYTANFVRICRLIFFFAVADLKTVNQTASRASEGELCEVNSKRN